MIKVSIKIVRRTLFGLALLFILLLMTLPVAVLFVHFQLRKRVEPEEPSAYIRFADRHPLLFDIQMYLGNFPVLEDKFRQLPPLTGRVLHLACGTGYGTKVMAERGAQFVNLDINEKNLEYGKRMGRLADYVVGDAYDLPFADRHFDNVIISYAFHHFQEPEKLFRECRRVLKDSGTLVIFDMVSTRERPLKWWNLFSDGFIWNYDRKTIQETVEYLARKTSLAVKSVSFSRPMTVMGFNPFYPVVECVIQVSPVIEHYSS
jgi:ubiquinone/menaquinone biosynthesis C-methylase UbiE